MEAPLLVILLLGALAVGIVIGILVRSSRAASEIANVHARSPNASRWALTNLKLAPFVFLLPFTLASTETQPLSTSSVTVPPITGW